jgi:transcriptional regulator with XRE-family HTH domain
MEISKLLSDKAILTELGERIARSRIDLQLTQAEAAERAGVSKRTLERIESGASAQMSSLIRIMRVLELLPRLDLTFPETGPTPMELLRNKGKARQRASTSSRPQQSDQPWTWEDDQ